MELLERDAVLTSARAGIDAAFSSAGSVLVIEGSPGVGKTSVAQAIADLGMGRGMRVLRARGGELEQDFPFGIVRQFFEPHLMALTDDERDRLMSGAARLAAPALGLEMVVDNPAADASFTVLHGLFWLTTALTAPRPLLIVLDDVHRADEPSLRWISYLTQRLEGLAAFLVLATRPIDMSGRGALLRQVASAPVAVAHSLQPLGTQGVDRFVRLHISVDVDPAFSDACHEVTGGNPLLLRELLNALLADGVTPTVQSVELVRGISPPSVSRWALLRLARLAPSASALAQAVAVLGGTAEIRHAAALAELGDQDAAAAADALVGADLFVPRWPLQFLHPLIKTAVYTQLAEGERTRAHARAAHLLFEHGAAPDEVAVHLLQTEPAGDPWVVAALRDAARDATTRGAPEVAATYLSRAAAETSPVETQADILLELGSAEVRIHAPMAVAHLEKVLQIAESPRTRLNAAMTLGQALMHADRSVDAVVVMAEAVNMCGEGDRELWLRLEAGLIAAAWNHTSTVAVALEHVERVSDGVEGRTPAERLILAELAVKVANSLGPATAVVKIAERALADGRLLAEEGPDSQILYMVINALGMAGQLRRGTDSYGSVIADAAARGSVIGFANASSVRAWFWYQRGAIAEAEADARGALVAAADMPWLIGPLARTVVADVMIERGDPDAASTALQFTAAAEALPDQIFSNFLLHTRARIAISQGRLDDAIHDLIECGRRLAAFCGDNPAMLGWRSTAATAYAALEDPAEARRLSDEEVAMCRFFGAARPLGVALRTAGLICGGEEGITLLGEAASVLAASEAVLEYARALTDYGGSLRRAGRRSAALPPLRLGLDLAHRCGAEALARRARSELLTAGARPRRRVISGVDALTASERRIAEMAAGGSANRDIAQALFVTERTVEGHLGNAYRKLDVTSRAQLRRALGG